MSKGERGYVSQGVAFVGFLNAQLRGLSGWRTLANELIQNADDAGKDGTGIATRISFDVTDRALIVDNDGLFSDCGDVLADACKFDVAGDGRKCCDFHAFRLVASGHKRHEEGTTGAFGIGFISVYQITDQPTLRSGDWEWILRPGAKEDERIEVVRMSQRFSGTRLELPWAFASTPLRQQLGQAPVSKSIVEDMCNELLAALSTAAPFLKRLVRLELRRQGAVVLDVQCDRDTKSGDILVGSEGDPKLWRRLDCTFDTAASGLRSRYSPNIESKRTANVTVAVPQGGLPAEGLLYASLPTEHAIPLPVLINADFYPTPDRKRIIFDAGYQGEWNRAAIQAAIHQLVKSLPDLRTVLKPKELWALFESAREIHRQAIKAPRTDGLDALWTLLAPQIKEGDYVYSGTSQWCKPSVSRLLHETDTSSNFQQLLKELGTEIVHPDLARFNNVLTAEGIGVKLLALVDIVEAFERKGLVAAMPLESVPVWLQSAKNRVVLGATIGRLEERLAKADRPMWLDRLRGCSLLLDLAGQLSAPKLVRKASKETRQVFGQLVADGKWASEGNAPDLLALAAEFTVKDAIYAVRQVGAEELSKHAQAQPQSIHKLIDWIAGRRSEVVASQELIDDINALSIWPSGNELCALDDLSVPGDFEDTLGLAQILDGEVSTKWRPFLLDDLHASELTLHVYIVEHVSRAFEQEPAPDAQTRRALIELLVNHLGTVETDPEVLAVLRGLPIVECADGEFRQGASTYFSTELVRLVLGETISTAVLSGKSPSTTKTLYECLGVTEHPRPSDLLARIDQIVAGPIDSSARSTIQSIFKALAENWVTLAHASSLTDLRTKPWLPSRSSKRWHPAIGTDAVCSVFRASLFESQANFLDIPAGIQRSNTGLLEFLGIRFEPTVTEVVGHVRNLIKVQRPIGADIYQFLDGHAADSLVAGLGEERCLYLDDGSFEAPQKALWASHPFGRFRRHLGDDWAAYARFLDRVGVKRTVAANDAVVILAEVAADYADNRQLTESDYAVVLQCWGLIALHADEIEVDLAAQFATAIVIPNARRFLKRPKAVFFEDRPGLANKFGGGLESHVIQRPEIGWRAMARAGVLPLSQAVSVELVECDNSRNDSQRTEILSQRWPLVRRALNPLSYSNEEVEPQEAPEVWSADKITLSYRLYDYSGLTEDVIAHLSGDKRRVYLLDGAPRLEGALARELAFGLCADGSAGHLAAAIKEILSVDSFEHAEAALDDLGIPRLQIHGPTALVSTPEGVGEGLETEYTQSENDSETQQSEPDPEPSGSDKRTSVAEPRGTGTQPEVTPTGNEQTEAEPGESVVVIPPKTPERAPRPHLRSYMVYGDKDEDGGMSEKAKAHRKRIDDMGIAQALVYEADRGRKPQKEDHFNKGFDIQSFDQQGSRVRIIEVKSMSGKWDGFGVGMSDAQFQCAQENKTEFWLYVVEGLDGEEPKLHAIPDPASKVAEYRFDELWREVGENEATTVRRSPLSGKSG